MRDYEGLFILKPDLEKEQLYQLYQKINDSIKKYKGEIEDKTEEWGKRRLAYKIGRYREGIYYLLRFKTEPSQITPLNTDLKLNESIIRIMFTQR